MDVSRARPAAHRWEVLDESHDPLPGDPELVAALGRKLRKVADVISKQADEIKALSDVDSWKGKAADKFRENAGDAGDKLRKVYKRYDEAAEALGERVREGDMHFAEYASELHRAQKMADKALHDAEQADEDRRSVQASLDKIEDDDKSGTKKLEERQSDADDAIRAAREALQTAKEIRDRAATRAAERIKDVIEHDGVKDSVSDKIGDFASSVANVVGKIGTALSVAALVLSWVPILGQVLGVLATLATVISLVAHLTMVLTGQGSWTEVMFDVIGLATLGIGKAAVTGAKAGIRGTKALAHSRLFNQTAKALQGKVRNPALEALKLAQKQAPGALLGSGRKALVDAIPQKPFPSFKDTLKALHPKEHIDEAMDAVKNPSKSSLTGLGDKDINDAAIGLKDLGKMGMDDPKIRAGMVSTAGHIGVWGGATVTDVLTGPAKEYGLYE